ncbi:type II toxin-antitoxin system RelE/ParE family toxin [Patescibacteria group bacterium]|nr:type II toxin-antitoxin system RelE/ParE family toxin [Patescibacteria group bacterium]MBU1472370.1 type II toxin-antitoxin system RelE/ParE family toxin [Patescibacteria group bacterium]MBU2459893.1 type II toxin-antitoxin system RelE/ParE family toxin [Patescibacteria group bacterium]MBU2544732.1 type II toxin-antitoxin system RelE/ParE family toxin [Patescibacteria group bacterium]
MITILPITRDLQSKVNRYNLRKKFEKQLSLLVRNSKHPSLRVELLEPKWRGICSFRIDRKYRALFIFRSNQQVIEILSVTVHYR